MRLGGVAVHRLGGGSGRLAAQRTGYRVPVGWRCAALVRCGGAAQVRVAAQVAEQLGGESWCGAWPPGRAQQTLGGAMAADGDCGIETKALSCNCQC